jgi:hypothetical protein
MLQRLFSGDEYLKQLNEKLASRLKLVWSQQSLRKFCDKLQSKDYTSKKFAKLSMKLEQTLEELNDGLQGAVREKCGLEQGLADQLGRDLKTFENSHLRGGSEDPKDHSKDGELLRFHNPTFPAYLNKSFETYKLLDSLVLVLVLFFSLVFWKNPGCSKLYEHLCTHTKHLQVDNSFRWWYQLPHNSLRKGLQPQRMPNFSITNKFLRSREIRFEAREPLQLSSVDSSRRSHI